MHTQQVKYDRKIHFAPQDKWISLKELQRQRVFKKRRSRVFFKQKQPEMNIWHS